MVGDPEVTIPDGAILADDVDGTVVADDKLCGKALADGSPDALGASFNDGL